MNMSPLAMNDAALQASELLKSLANRHRLLIVCQLIDGARSVGQMAEFLGIRDSTVSQHLALLRKDGIVTTEREGQTIWYSIASGPAREVLKALYRVYCGSRPTREPDITKAALVRRKKETRNDDGPRLSARPHAHDRP
jgi:DNA-binding transcriptional ArsR family regulator